MQAVVKTPHIKVNIEGEIPENLLKVLKENFGNKLKIIDNPDEEVIDAFETDWYKDIKKKMKPSDYIRIDRQNKNLTQAELGKLIGNTSRQYISDIEKGKRVVSLKLAKELAKVFDRPVERYI